MKKDIQDLFMGVVKYYDLTLSAKTEKTKEKYKRLYLQARCEYIKACLDNKQIEKEMDMTFIEMGIIVNQQGGEKC